MTLISFATVLDLVGDLTPPSEAWRERALRRIDSLTKPPGSLGRLEALAAQLVAIRQAEISLPIGKTVYIFAADHGVTVEGVSAYPSAVTHQMVLNFLAGGAAVNVLARLHDAELHVVDVGVDADFDGCVGLLHHKIARGTRNMRYEPAMSDGELSAALAVGGRLAAEAAAAGHRILAIGEMGIGNTTSASAITCALTGSSVALATGRGTGIDAAAHARKIATVETILTQHSSDLKHPLDILRCVGGLEIASMVGMMLAAPRHRIAVVADGFISTAAAALAVAIEPMVRNYIVASHRSEEPGHLLLLEYLQLTPILSLEMRLGEGSGAVLVMPVLESAIALYSQMATFASAGVSEASV
jgi:nicotinate-nucleotide--dimethylbenzimidazole phosphoribosyltransferase